MMYGKSKPHIQVSMADLRLHRKVLFIACAVLLVAVIALGLLLLQGGYSQDKARDQLSQRMYSACSSALDEVNRIGGIITSNTPSRLGRVRQYIYFMEQLNLMSVSMYGEGGRMAPDEAFAALYDDLDHFEAQVQQSTNSTNDIRTLLSTHLNALQVYLVQP